MSDSLSFSDIYMEELSLLPTAFSRSVPFDQVCCALHGPTQCVDRGVGCDVIKVGTHKSVRAVYESGIKYCHAEVGQRVLDKKLFQLAVEWGEYARYVVAERPKSFDRRFKKGYPVGVHVYGSGYCYLELFQPTVRSRIARCLGPLPLVADVARMYIIAGNIEGLPLVFEELKSGAFHVVASDKFKKVSYDTLLATMFTIIRADPYAKVGGDVPQLNISEFKAKLHAVLRDSEIGTGPGEMFMELGAPSEGFLSNGAVPVVSGFIVDQKRMQLLHEWFGSYGVDVHGDQLHQLYLITTATAVYPAGMHRVKDHVKMMAVVGDSVLKLLMAHSVLVGGLSPARYTAIGERATNKYLSVLFDNIGLRAVSDVGLLSVDSKQNADIFEAVVGFMSLHYSLDIVVKFLVSVGILEHFKFNRFNIPVGSGYVGLQLNSQQQEIVVKMINSGLI